MGPSATSFSPFKLEWSGAIVLRAGTEFPCFTSTKIKILTPEERYAGVVCSGDLCTPNPIHSMPWDHLNEVLTLLDLMVQKYKY